MHIHNYKKLRQKTNNSHECSLDVGMEPVTLVPAVIGINYCAIESIYEENKDERL